jgi:hypothetical protein
VGTSGSPKKPGGRSAKVDLGKVGTKFRPPALFWRVEIISKVDKSGAQIQDDFQ